MPNPKWGWTYQEQLVEPKCMGYESVVETGLFHSVYVVTEDQEIYDEIVNAGGNSILSKNKHESGSDRIAEACESIDSDAFVNIQGDEPVIDSFSLNKLVLELNSSEYVSLMINISDSRESLTVIREIPAISI